MVVWGIRCKSRMIRAVILMSGNHWLSMDSPHKGPIMWEFFLVMMLSCMPLVSQIPLESIHDIICINDAFRLRQNGCHFAHNIFKLIFLYENCSLIQISLKLIPKEQASFISDDDLWQNRQQAITWLNDDLTHWGRVTHICVGKLTTIGSNNGLSPGQRQAIIWTNAGLLLIIPFETNFSEILIEIHIFSFKQMHLKMSSVKWQPFCLGLNALIYWVICVTQPQWDNHKKNLCHWTLMR